MIRLEGKDVAIVCREEGVFDLSRGLFDGFDEFSNTHDEEAVRWFLWDALDAERARRNHETYSNLPLYPRLPRANYRQYSWC